MKSGPATSSLDNAEYVKLRKLATYLQYRLDRAGSGDMKISQEIVGQFVVLIEEVIRSRRESRG